MTRISTALWSGATELRRTPVLLALLVVAPAYVIYLFTLVAPEGTAVVHIGEDAVRAPLGGAFPAFTTPMTAALLSGITGLFLMHSSAVADSRLVVAGYRSHQVVLARLGLLLGVAAVATAVSVGVMLTAFDPEHVGWFVLGTGLTALIYGMVGVLAGVLLARITGVYLILFGSMIDLFIFQNPLATDPPDIAQFFPGHYPLRVAMDAGFTGSVEATAIGWTFLYLGILTTIATGAFYRKMRIS